MSSLFGMFHFANPLGLLALLAVAVPILIHLLNKSKGNLVVVGTLDFIRGAKSKRVTEVKLTNLILLLLRIAILALAAFCVAELMSTKGKGTSESSVFVTPAWAEKASREDWLSAFSTANSGTASILSEDIKSINISDIDDIVDVKNQNFSVAGTLLGELSEKQYNGPVHVFATNKASDLSDIGALGNFDIVWHIDEAPSPTDADQRVLSIILVKDNDFGQQAADIAKAIRTLSEHRSISLTLQVFSAEETPSQENGEIDWLVWASRKDLGAWSRQLKAGGRILKLSPDTTESGTPENISLGSYPFTQFRASVSPSKAHQGKDIWQTVGGVPLLTQEHNSQGKEYELQFSLSDGPDSLSKQPEFPIVLLSLLMNDRDELHQRYPAATVNAPAPTESADTEISGLRQPVPTRLWLALILIALWSLERYVSERVRHD